MGQAIVRLHYSIINYDDCPPSAFNKYYMLNVRRVRIILKLMAIIITNSYKWNSPPSHRRRRCNWSLILVWCVAISLRLLRLTWCSSTLRVAGGRWPNGGGSSSNECAIANCFDQLQLITRLQLIIIQRDDWQWPHNNILFAQVEFAGNKNSQWDSRRIKGGGGRGGEWIIFILLENQTTSRRIAKNMSKTYLRRLCGHKTTFIGRRVSN